MSQRRIARQPLALSALLAAGIGSFSALPASAQVPPAPPAPPAATAPLPQPAPQPTAPLPQPAAQATAPLPQPAPQPTAPLSQPAAPQQQPASGSGPAPLFGAPAGSGGPPLFLPPGGQGAGGVGAASPGGGGGGFGGAPPSDAVDQFRRKKRLIIAGATLFGLAYYGSLVASSVGVSRNKQGSKEYIAGLFPLVGPFITAGSRAAPDIGKEADYPGMGLYLGLGAVQVLGAGLFILGLKLPTGQSPSPCGDRISAALYTPAAAGSDTPPYRPCASISLQPIVTPAFGGLGLTGTF